MIIKRSIVFSIYLYVTIQNYVLGLVIKLQVQFNVYDVFKSEEPKFRCPTVIRYNPVESGGTKKFKL